MKRILTNALLSLALGAGAIAAPNARETQDETIRKLLARLESLEAEVRHLKAGSAATPGDGKAAAMLAESEPGRADEAAARGSYPELKLRGFGHVDYRWTDDTGDKNAFALGQFDLFITSQLAENVSVLSENVIEADEEGHFGFEIERLVLQYTPSEYFNIAIGRYHTALGYYNTAYHHGTWLQTAVGRPEFLEFEDDGGMLPIHNVGVSVSGAIPSGKFGVRYVAEVGNGRDYTPGAEPVQGVSDKNDFKAVNLALFARPDWMPGFQAGVSVYFDRLSAGLLPTVNQTIVSAHAVYLSPAFEWLNEGVLLRDSSRLGTFETRFFYTQVARQFGKFRPYARYQCTEASEDDPIVQIGGIPGEHQTLSLGVRYNFTELAAFKLQWDRALGGDGGGNGLTLQVSFTY